MFDSKGDYFGLEYNDTPYYYIKNLQGDVIAICNNAGNTVVTYEYDAWGRLMSYTDTTGFSLVTKNPIRYRGYYFDHETGFYYLKSRYYSPEICRFLSPDVYVSTGQGILGYNMFAYCNNNPANLLDNNGDRPIASTSVDNEAKDDRDMSFQFVKGNIRIDITNKLNFAMKQNANILNNYNDSHCFVETILFFVNKVKPNGEWDFKSQDNWHLNPNITYVYNGQRLRFDDIGNIHYGYVGNVIFSSSILLVAGGIVQIYTHTSKWSYINSNFDDPRDQWAIGFGCELWKRGI